MTRERSGLRPWPPTPYPPREPNPHGDDLLEPVDWMTFSHRDLYLMATTRLRLETARELSGEWLRVGRKLDEIAGKLIRLNQLTRGAWEGSAAELARDTGKQLSTWADESGNGARGVADYLDRHASNAEWASRAMPEPDNDRGAAVLPNWRRDDPNDDGPDLAPAGPAVNGGGTTPSSAGGMDFEAARFLVEDEGEARERRQRKHQRAAEVMTRMQANAVEILGTIPRFTTPAVAARPDPARTADDYVCGGTTAAGFSGPGGAGGPETSAPGARSMDNGPERAAAGVSHGGQDSRLRGPVTFGAAPFGGTTATGRELVGVLGGADRRGGPGGLFAPGAVRGGGGDDTKRRSRSLVGGDASVFEPAEDPVATDDAGDDETSHSPGFAPLPPISLDRLPGNWVRKGA